MLQFRVNALARRLDLPPETLRGWWDRFRARSPTLLAEVVEVAVGLDAAPLDVRQTGEAVVFEALEQSCQRARRRFGEQRIGQMWRFWSYASNYRRALRRRSAPFCWRATASGWRSAPFVSISSTVVCSVPL